MQRFIKFSLSAIAAATLAACGGGSDSASTSPNPPPATNSTAPIGSAAVFLPAGQTSVTYNLDTCQHEQFVGNISSKTNGGTATLTLNDAGVVSVTYSGIPGPGGRPANSITMDASNTSISSLDISKVASNGGNLNYAYSLGTQNDEGIEVEYEPSNYMPGTRNNNSNVSAYFVDGTNVVCAFATNPGFSPSILNYNARIAQLVASVTSFDPNITTPTPGVAQWANGDTLINNVRNFKFARLNLSTGQLSSSGTNGTPGTFSDFDINARLTATTQDFGYREQRQSGLSGDSRITVYEKNTNDAYDFTVNTNSTQLIPRAYFD
jgi:hypothetical protein